MIVSMFLSVAHCAWTSLLLGNVSNMEMNTDQKSLQIFMDLKRPLNWLKNQITKIDEKLNETVKKCLN